MLERALTDPDFVTQLEDLGSLGPIAVAFDFSAGDGLGREGASLEEPGRPEPLVQPKRFGGRVSGFHGWLTRAAVDGRYPHVIAHASRRHGAIGISHSISTTPALQLNHERY